jgi:hypothetical protein
VFTASQPQLEMPTTVKQAQQELKNTPVETLQREIGKGKKRRRRRRERRTNECGQPQRERSIGASERGSSAPHLKSSRYFPGETRRR